jgi:hypothetical protein
MGTRLGLVESCIEADNDAYISVIRALALTLINYSAFSTFSAQIGVASAIQPILEAEMCVLHPHGYDITMK